MCEALTTYMHVHWWVTQCDCNKWLWAPEGEAPCRISPVVELSIKCQQTAKLLKMNIVVSLIRFNRLYLWSTLPAIGQNLKTTGVRSLISMQFICRPKWKIANGTIGSFYHLHLGNSSVIVLSLNCFTICTKSSSEADKNSMTTLGWTMVGTSQVQS